MIDRRGSLAEADEPAGDGRARRRRRNALLLILALSTLLKLALLGPAAGLRPRGDEIQYLQAGRAIAALGVPVYPNPRWDEAHASPVMPYMLGGCYVLFGETGYRPAARCLQILLSALTILLVHHAAARAFDRRVALIAATITAFYPPLIAFTQYFYTETVYIFFLMAAAAILVGGSGVPSGRRAFAAGLAAGFAALTRSVFLTQVPLVILWLALAGHGDRARRIRAVTGLLAGMILLVGPWSIRNTVRYDRFLLIDTNAGNVLHRNVNAMRPENHDIGLGRLRHEQSESYRADVPIRPRVQVDNIVDRNNAEIRAAIRFVFAHPGHYARNCLTRTAAFLNPTSFLVRTLRTDPSIHLPRWLIDLIVSLTLLLSMAVMLSGVIGLVARPPNAGRLLMILLIAGNVAVSVLIISMSRYRLPMMPLLIPFAADGALRLREFLFAPRSRLGWIFAAALIIPLLWVWATYLPYSFPR